MIQDMFPLVLFVLILNVVAGRSGGGADDKDLCQPDKLVVYKVVIATFWTRERFSKQYPEFRPHAQFSKVVGKSNHSNSVVKSLLFFFFRI